MGLTKHLARSRCLVADWCSLLCFQRFASGVDPTTLSVTRIDFEIGIGKYAEKGLFS